MSYTQDLNPENQFNHVEAMHELDGAELTSLTRFRMVDQTVAEDVAMVDRVYPEISRPMAQAPESGQTTATVTDLQEYRERREMRHEARQRIDEHAQPVPQAPVQPQVDPQAEHLNYVNSMIDQARRAA